MFQSYCPTDDATSDRCTRTSRISRCTIQFGFSQNPGSCNLSAFWEPFQGSKVLSFSTPVHTLATGFGIVSYLVHYYPEVSPSPRRASEGLHGFFLAALERELGWDVVRALIGRPDSTAFTCTSSAIRASHRSSYPRRRT